MLLSSMTLNASSLSTYLFVMHDNWSLRYNCNKLHYKWKASGFAPLMKYGLHINYSADHKIRTLDSVAVFDFEYQGVSLDITHRSLYLIQL